MFHVIANPISGRGKSHDISEKIQKHLLDKKINFVWYETKYVNHPKEVSESIEKEYPNGGEIIVIGGDGTFNEVVNGIKNLDKWKFGLIPAGSGNDLAFKLGFNKKEPLQAIEYILENETKYMDYIQVNDKRCINILGTGIDVDILCRFEKYNKLRGKFRYLMALFVTLFKFKWYDFEMCVDDGEVIKKQGFITALCNGANFGGGIPICSFAKIDDNKLNFVFIEKLKKWKIPFYLVKLLKGTIYKSKHYFTQECSKVIYTNSKPFTINIDGQLIENNRFECSIIKNGIKIYRK